MITVFERMSSRAAWVLWLSVLALATLGLLAVRARINEAHVAIAYLMIVQAASAHRGRVLGLTLSALAMLAFDVLFLQPYGSLVISRSIDAVMLIAFLTTSVIAAQLFERARERARMTRQIAVRDAVVSTVSHDLRTPLTTIRALAHDLASDGDERALTIEEEAERLGRLVGDILDLSQLDRGAAHLNIESNEAEDLIGAALQRVSGLANGREIRVNLDPNEPLLFGRFDFAQTLRALVNLLENALKYSPSSEPVDLAVERVGPWLYFAVLDRGPGIPVEESERIFEPFYRPEGTAPDTNGAGLGLSIAKAVAVAQKGNLMLTARPGGGAVFTLSVPAVDLRDLATGQ